MSDSVNLYGALQIFQKGKGKKRIKLKGIISTEHRDRQGEVILQDGLDFKPFLDYGWFNDNHSSKSNDVLGYPERVYRTTIKGENGETIQATAVEGYLLPTARGKQLLEISESLKGDPKRSLGFSVEGQVMSRNDSDQSIINQAVIKHVAITHVPVNPNTTLEALSKAMTSQSIAPVMPESLEGSSSVLTANPIIRASVIARNHKTKGKDMTTDYLSMFKMLPKGEADKMMEAYQAFKGDEMAQEESDNMVNEKTDLDKMSELEKMQYESDLELGLIEKMGMSPAKKLMAKSEADEADPVLEKPDEEPPAVEDGESSEEVQEADEASEPADVDEVLNKGMNAIEQAVQSDLDISDLSQYLTDDSDIQNATEIDASGFLKSLVDGNQKSLDNISKALTDFGQQQRATNLTVLALGQIVKSLQTQFEDLNESLNNPVRAKGATSVPQAQAMAKSFENDQVESRLSKSQILNNLQDKLVKNLDDSNLSARITDAIIRYESTGAISDDMLRLAQN